MALSPTSSHGGGTFNGGTITEPLTIDLSAHADAVPLTLFGVPAGGQDLLTVKDGASVEMEMDDFYFGPTYLTGPAGAKVTLELSNEGQKNHTFTIDSAKIDQQVDPGQKATVQVTMPASGSLAFYCKFHVSGGMQGAFAIG